MTPTVRLPAGPVTPHGAYHILRDRIPQVNLTSFDESVRLDIMGGLAIADRQAPERVELKGMKGLIPPWQTIDQKGATEDGVTFVDALYDGIEVEMEVVCHGRNPGQCRRVVNYLIGSIDAKKESRLSWFTHEMGYWWAPIRWFKTPANEMGRPAKRQPMSLRLRADSGFWRSFPWVSDFRFNYTATGDDDFETDGATLDSALWATQFTGGSGGLFIEDGFVKNTLNNRSVVARRKVYTASSDNMVVELQFGTFGQWFFPPDVEVQIWLRAANTGTPGDDGTCVTLSSHHIKVSSFDGGVETVLRERDLIIPPLPNEKWTFIAGAPALFGLIPADPRRFKILRGGAPIMLFKEQGTASQIGASFRSVGFGLSTSGSSAPVTIAGFNAGGNVVETQSGFVNIVNAGDQDGWIEWTLFGPFDKVKLWDGPNAGLNEYVEFGPLNASQVVQIRTDPRKYGVKDLTATPATPAEQAAGANAIQNILSFITLNNITHALDVLQSIFGIFGGGSAAVPPQGNLYSLLKGRFAKSIPAKSPGLPAELYHVKVEITNGTADSQVIASLIPLRRYPY